MTIKDVRNKTGLTQKVFAAYYHIPLQTLKQWESNEQSSSFRSPPDYVVYLIDRLVTIDGAYRSETDSRRVSYLQQAAIQSRDNAREWFRYLRKELMDKSGFFSWQDMCALLEGKHLSLFQKITLKRAMEAGTVTNQYVSGLNKPANTPILDQVRRKQNNV